jgi:hypothetical protein
VIRVRGDTLDRSVGVQVLLRQGCEHGLDVLFPESVGSYSRISASRSDRHRNKQCAHDPPETVSQLGLPSTCMR